MSKERIFGLDILRALAILIVVYGHGYIVAPNLVTNYFPSFPLPEGVDLFWFFTLSLSTLTYYFIEKPFLLLRDK